MAGPTPLQRLLRIRDLEEEQRRLALESALGELNQLKGAMKSARVRERQGRQLVGESARSGQGADRQAGLVQTLCAKRQAAVLEPRLADAQEEAARLRREVLEKRVECRQAETLIEENEARAALETGRRDQRVLDDWYRSRKFREEGMGVPADGQDGTPKP